MNARENYKIHRDLGNKEYYIPEDDHPIREALAAGLAACEFSTDLKDARVEVMAVYPNISKTTGKRNAIRAWASSPGIQPMDEACSLKNSLII